jgi:hypothetical protein
LFSISSPQELAVYGEIAVTYQSLEELENDADLVVLGKFVGNPRFDKGRSIDRGVSKKNPEVTESQTPEEDAARKLIAQRRPSYRELTFQVTEVLKGELSNAKPGTPKIKVGQVAGQSGTTVVGVSGDRLFQPGEEYILYLSSDSLLGEDFYWVTGANQGTFVVKGNQVDSLNNQANVDDVGPKVKGESLDKFKSKIKPKLNRP